MVVGEEAQAAKIYTIYFKFVKEVLSEKISEQEEIKEIMQQNPDIDFI